MVRTRSSNLCSAVCAFDADLMSIKAIVAQTLPNCIDIQFVVQATLFVGTAEEGQDVEEDNVEMAFVLIVDDNDCCDEDNICVEQLLMLLALLILLLIVLLLLLLLLMLMLLLFVEQIVLLPFPLLLLLHIDVFDTLVQLPLPIFVVHVSPLAVASFC